MLPARYPPILCKSKGTARSAGPAATERVDSRQWGTAGKGHSAMNTYVMSKLVQYKQHDLAREYGRRNWRELFRA